MCWFADWVTLLSARCKYKMTTLFVFKQHDITRKHGSDRLNFYPCTRRLPMFRCVPRPLFPRGNLPNADCRVGRMDPRFFGALFKKSFFFHAKIVTRFLHSPCRNLVSMLTLLSLPFSETLLIQYRKNDWKNSFLCEDDWFKCTKANNGQCTNFALAAVHRATWQTEFPPRIFKVMSHMVKTDFAILATWTAVTLL